MTATIKVKNLPPAPAPTKAYRNDEPQKRSLAFDFWMKHYRRTKGIKKGDDYGVYNTSRF